MNDKTFLFWQKWLTYANIITLIIGILVAFAGNSFFFNLHNEGTQQVFFEGEVLSEPVMKFKNWLFGIIGGTIVGFHALMIFISENAFKRKEKWSYSALWIGLISWFLIDSSISAFYGAFYNILLINIVALIAIGIPLLMTWKVFLGANTR